MSRKLSYESRSIVRAPSVATRGDADQQRPLRQVRAEVLDRDRGRVHVRERLVGLVDGDGEQREHGADTARRDRDRQGGGVGDVAGEEEHGAQQPEPRPREEVPDRGPPEGAAAVAGEACVVGDERDPRDRDRDDEVDAVEHREPAFALAIPERAEAGAVERPPRQVEQRREHGPDGELAHELADEPDRAEQGERERDAAEEQRPEPLRPEAEELVREGGDSRGDDQQFEDRPANALRRVQDRGSPGAPPAERRPHQHHRRYARVGADHRGDAEHRVADETAEDDREEGLRQRECGHEVRPCDEHEQRDTEAAPEETLVEEAEHAQPLGHRRDSPGGRVVHRLCSSLRRHYPDQVSGCVLSPVGRAPRSAATLTERSGAPRGRPRFVPLPSPGSETPSVPGGDQSSAISVEKSKDFRRRAGGAARRGGCRRGAGTHARAACPGARGR